MYKEIITYTDLNGVERTEEYLFNLTKAELIEMELSKSGGFADLLDRIIKAKDTPDIIREVKRLLLTSYGKKSEDGRHFLKSPEIRQEFECSEPYSIMFMKLISDDEAAAKFVNAIMPKDVAEAAANAMASNGGAVPKDLNVVSNNTAADHNTVTPQLQPVINPLL